MIKQFLQFILPAPIFKTLQLLNKQRRFMAWVMSGRPLPPPHFVKQDIIKAFKKKHNINVLVETGTFLGQMVNAQKSFFKKIISIELQPELFRNAVKKFEAYKHITILQGDSGKVLSSVMKDIDEPAIFFLDGHYSSDGTAKGDKFCPIYEELDAIFSAKQKFNHVLLIDDAIHFVGENDYPTIEELKKFIQKKNSRYTIQVKDNVICCEVA